MPSASQKACSRVKVSLCLYSVFSARSSPRLLSWNRAMASSTRLGEPGAAVLPSSASSYCCSMIRDFFWAVSHVAVLALLRVCLPLTFHSIHTAHRQRRYVLSVLCSQLALWRL